MKKSFKCMSAMALAAAMLLLADINSSAQIRIQAGYSSSTEHSGDATSDPIKGFHLGATYDYALAEGNFGEVALQPGVFYEYLSNKDFQYGNYAKAKSYEHYINVPVMFKYSYEFVDDTFGAFLFAGPTFSFGLASQIKLTYDAGVTSGDIVYHRYSGKVTSDEIGQSILDVLFPGGGTDYGWFDAKLGVGGGVTIMDMIDVKAGYDWGLVNRYTGDGDGKLHSNHFYVGVAYKF